MAGIKFRKQLSIVKEKGKITISLDLLGKGEQMKRNTVSMDFDERDDIPLYQRQKTYR